MRSRPSVAVVGSVNLDLVSSVERLPRPGETVTARRFQEVPGGKGANQAVAAARLGAHVRLVACVGLDPNAVRALAEVRAAGVELEVAEVDMPTGTASIAVDEAGETTIVVNPGANAELRPEHVDVARATAALCQLEIPTPAVAAAADQATFFCLNAAPARRLPAELVAQADLLVANRYELDELGTEPRGLLAVTSGAEGAVLYEAGSEIARARPPKVVAVDGTAAGDAFTACLLVSLLEGRHKQEALERACAAGALAASRRGAQPSLPTADEVDEILSR